MDRRNEWWNVSTSVVTAPEPDPVPGAGMDAWRAVLVIDDDDDDDQEDDDDPCNHSWQCPTCYGDPDCEHEIEQCPHCSGVIGEECDQCGWEPDCRTGHRDMACTECSAPYPQ